MFWEIVWLRWWSHVGKASLMTRKRGCLEPLKKLSGNWLKVTSPWPRRRLIDGFSKKRHKQIFTTYCGVQTPKAFANCSPGQRPGLEIGQVGRTLKEFANSHRCPMIAATPSGLRLKSCLVPRVAR